MKYKYHESDNSTYPFCPACGKPLISTQTTDYTPDQEDEIKKEDECEHEWANNIPWPSYCLKCGFRSMSLRVPGGTNMFCYGCGKVYLVEKVDE